MRRIIYYTATSLDGYIARPDGAIDWLFQGEDGEDYGYAEFLDGVDTTIMGHTTYRQVLRFGDFPYAGKTNYVLTRTPDRPAEPHVQFVGGDLAEFARKLKRADGGNIWLVGGGASAHPIISAGLADEFVLAIHPVILGQGLPLFHIHSHQYNLRLTGHTAYPNGLLITHYTKATNDD